MKEKFRKYLPIGLLSLALLFTASFLVYIAFMDDNLYQTTETTSSRIRYVLVNEDEGAVFQGKPYQLGADFVTMINQDSDNSWETASRAVAQNGINSDQYDVAIIIPKNFSTDLLSLESIDPNKATLEYVVREGQNEAANHQIQNQANEILALFNQRVIQMYFSSILGNLTNAQNTVSKIVRNETVHTSTLISQIQNPLSSFPSSFESIYTLSNQLKAQNDLFNSQQDGFIKATQDMLTANTSSLSSANDAVLSNKELLDKLLTESNNNFQISLKQFEAQLENQAQQLEQQWKNDKEHYALYQELVTRQLEKYYNVALNEDTSVTTNFVSFLVAYKAYQNKIASERAGIEEAIANLENEKAELQKTLDGLAENYYGNLSIDGEKITDPTKITDKEIQKKIIAAVLKREHSELKKYTDLIDSYVGSVSVQNLDMILSTLESRKLIDADSINRYREQLKIVGAYSAQGGSSNAPIFTEPTEVDRVANFVQHTSMNVELNEGVHHLVFTTSNSDVSMSVDASAIQSQLDGQLDGTGYTAVVTTTDNEIILTVTYDEKNVKITETEETKTVPSEQEKPAEESTTSVTETTEDASPALTSPSTSSPTVGTPASTTITTKVITKETAPKQISFTVPVTYHWSVTGEQVYNQATISWNLQERVVSENKLVFYDGAMEEIANQLGTIIESFTSLERASQAIAVLYGDPDKLTVTDVASELSQGTSLDELSERSMMDSYYQIPAEKIPDEFVVSYWSAISTLYTDTHTQLDKLQTRLGTNKIEEVDSEGTVTSKINTDVKTLYGLRNSMVLPDELENSVRELFKWYHNANEEIKNAWLDSGKLTSKSIRTEENGEPAATDTRAVNQQLESIVTDLNNLSTSSKELSTSIINSAAKVEDITPAIEELTQTTNSVQRSAQSILTELNQTISATSETLVENQAYSENFSTVMANAKIGGTDNPEVFNFLSAPIVMEGTQASIAVKSLLPYYMTLVGSMIALMTSFLLSKVMKDRQAKVEESFITPNILWLNVPNVTKIGLLSVLMSIVFAATTTMFAKVPNDGLWFMYTFLFIFASINLLTLGLRWFKQYTYYVIVLVFGLYLVLTPILGVSTKTGSFVASIYRLSPLQNIETGYSMIIAGNSIGALSMLSLLLLGGVGLGLHFIIKNRQEVTE